MFLQDNAVRKCKAQQWRTRWQKKAHFLLYVSAFVRAPVVSVSTAIDIPRALFNESLRVRNENMRDVSPFRIVIDVGSTGSRLHIFELVESPVSESYVISGGNYRPTAELFKKDDTRIECLRRGSSKAWTPLSAVARSQTPYNDGSGAQVNTLNATHVAHHMLPLFDYASVIIPPNFHSSTPIRIAATAGMRLLSYEEQIRTYDALYTGLLEQIPFGQFAFTSLKREDIMTLDGKREGFFGAVAANYLRGVIDAELNVIDYLDEEDVYDIPNDLASQDSEVLNGLCTNKFGMCEEDAENVVFGPSRHYVPQQRHDVRTHGPLGALDMGGSSTQIVYRSKELVGNGAEEVNNGGFDATVGNNDGMSTKEYEDAKNEVLSHLHDEDFFSISYLSYGADQFRERLWDLWVSEAKQNCQVNSQVMKQLNTEENIIANPCSFVGYEVTYKGYILRGTGDAVECSNQINRLIPYHDNVIDLDELYCENLEASKEKSEVRLDTKDSVTKGKLVGGVEHPPIRGKFYGMSLYFFTLDCMRELSDPDHPIHVSWPTPSIEELTHALDPFCARKWQGDLEEVQHEAHEHTRAEALPHRCVEAVYMVTLLRDGFGFHPTSRDITFTQYVDGSEVEWSLGMALSEYAAEKRVRKLKSEISS